HTMPLTLSTLLRLLSCFIFFFLSPPPPHSTLFPYTTLFRSRFSTSGRSPGSPRSRTCWSAASTAARGSVARRPPPKPNGCSRSRSEEHTSELQSRGHLVCRLLLEKKKTRHTIIFLRALPAPI